MVLRAAPEPFSDPIASERWFFVFYALSSREPESASLENALGGKARQG